MGKYVLSLWLLAVLLPSVSRAQIPATPPTEATNVEVDPIRCWWRTSVGSIRIGETFDVALTCAVLENEDVQVVPDESRLGNAVVQMAPFEVLAGARPADLHSGQRRFFQYQYTLRLISPDAIGKDVRIPDVVLHYRVNSRIAANMELQGRDLVYVLPPQVLRVASLVPVDAPDIRDATGESFSTIEALGFRAGVLEILAVGLVALGSLMILLVLVRLARGSRQRTPAGRQQLDMRRLVRLAVGELSQVQREREQQGWSGVLADRALAATRIASAAAIGRPVSQRETVAGTPAGEGRLVTRGVRRGTWRSVSSPMTPEDVARALERLDPGANQRAVLEQLRESLATFAVVQYGREAATETTAQTLDRALASAIEAARRVKADHAWPKSVLNRSRTVPALEPRA